MRSFLVEGHLTNSQTAELEAVASRAAAVVTESTGIRHVGSLVLREDEIFLHVFEAPSLAALAGASERAELAHERIVETVWIPPGASP